MNKTIDGDLRMNRHRILYIGREACNLVERIANREDRPFSKVVLRALRLYEWAYRDGVMEIVAQAFEQEGVLPISDKEPTGDD